MGIFSAKCRKKGLGRVIGAHSDRFLPQYAVREVTAQRRIKILPIQGEKQLQSVQIVLHESKVILPQVAGWIGRCRHVPEKVAAAPNETK